MKNAFDLTNRFGAASASRGARYAVDTTGGASDGGSRSKMKLPLEPGERTMTGKFKPLIGNMERELNTSGLRKRVQGMGASIMSASTPLAGTGRVNARMPIPRGRSK